MPCAPPIKCPHPSTCLMPRLPVYPCVRAHHKHATEDRQAMINRGAGKCSHAHARTRQPALWLPHGAALPSSSRRVARGGVERFTKTMPVTTPELFHGCETHDGV